MSLNGMQIAILHAILDVLKYDRRGIGGLRRRLVGSDHRFRFVVRVALCQCGQNKAISRSPAAPETSKELTEFIATSCIEDLAQEEATQLVLLVLARTSESLRPSRSSTCSTV